jgi:exopolysaccharide biosynthesis polyprenyl glycosylphosphotransferase
MAVTTVPPEVTRTVDTTASGAIEVALPRRPVVHWERHYVTLAAVGDAAVAYVAGTAAFLFLSDGFTPPSTYLLLTLLLPIAWVASIAVTGGYQRKHLSVGPEEFNKIATASVAVLAVVATASWLLDLETSRGYVAIAVAGATVGSLVGRYGLRKHVHKQRGLGHYQRRTLLVGSRQTVDHLADHLHRHDYHGYGVVATLTPAGETGAAKCAAITDALQSHRADTVAITAESHLDADELRQLAWQLEPLGVSLFVAPNLMEVAGPRLSVHPVEGVSLLRIDQPRLAGGKRLLKETADSILALLGLVALAPVLLGIGIMVRRDSPGPALFRQTRIGRYGERFEIVKFRTMTVDAEARRHELAHLNEAAGPLFKVAHDPRVTRIGAFLRRTSLDELPQLWNVLRGQMSLVGPRPYLPAEVAEAGADIRRRLIAKPGMTGLWQVSGRSNLTWNESVAADLRYVENWSLGLDAMILWKTCGAVTRGSGAY